MEAIGSKESITLDTDSAATKYGQFFSDRYVDYGLQAVKFKDYSAINNKDNKLGAAILGHILKEQIEGFNLAFKLAHDKASEFESLVMADFTKHREAARQEFKISAKHPDGIDIQIGVTFKYSTISYDIMFKTNTLDVAYVLVRQSNQAGCNCPKKK
jgi:hypothetical protein